ncbi:hypothetical protein QR680_002171 [Steinernema hermaphroditum]|uniref:CWH43-like N-terminal domain-containing protein n=1 Tax=Steinernema hermaphroditum TaxID=289476 RepID=A0AA39H2F3_9BILA|nr:hypothetical protein QR680_002171 [Steinernema hermaphroditum]
MRRKPSLLIAAIVTLLVVVFYFGSNLSQPLLYSLKNEDDEGKKCFCGSNLQDFCYRLPENESIVGQQFNCAYEVYLERFGLSDQAGYVDLEKDDLPNPVFVTAFSNSHYNEGLTLISTIRKYFPNQKVVVYDLGMHPVRVKTLQTLCNVEYRKFRFRNYPPYVRHLHEYRWKPLLIAETLNDFRSIWYMDASIRIKTSNLEHIYDLLRCRQSGRRIYQNFTSTGRATSPAGWDRSIWKRNLLECSKIPYMFHSFTGHGIYATTHPDVYRFIPTNFDKLKTEKAQMYEAGLVFVVKTREVVENLLKWYVLCALEKECMAPLPFTAQCQFDGNDRYKAFANCHSADEVASAMAYDHVWIIPVLSSVFAIAAFFAGYGIGVANNDEYPLLSYISDGGAIPPESCVFGQLLNISAMFMAITIYLRHRQFVEFYVHRNHLNSTFWSNYDFAMMFLGFIIALGISMVANFQEGAIPIAHMIGALAAFIGAVIYCWGQIALSYILKPRMTPLWLNHLRVLIHLVATGALILNLVCEFAKPFVNETDGVRPTKPPPNKGIYKIDTDSPYYINHIVTTSAEWAMGLLLEIFVLSFAWELRIFYFRVPKVYVKPKYRKNTVRFDTTPVSCLDALDHNDAIPQIPRVILDDDNDFEPTARPNTNYTRKEYLY